MQPIRSRAHPERTWSDSMVSIASTANWGNRLSLLLRNLFHHPEEEIRQRLFDPESLELGCHLSTVIGRMIDNVAQHRPRWQRRGSAAPAKREDGIEPLRRQCRLKLLEAPIGALQQP